MTLVDTRLENLDDLHRFAWVISDSVFLSLLYSNIYQSGEIMPKRGITLA